MLEKAPGTKSGYKNVQERREKSKTTYRPYVRDSKTKKMQYLGTFPTAVAAATCYARHVAATGGYARGRGAAISLGNSLASVTSTLVPIKDAISKEPLPTSALQLISKGSSTKIWWLCTKCQHCFEKKPCKVAQSRSGGCAYCAPRNRKLCGHADCQWCFAHSLASHDREMTMYAGPEAAHTVPAHHNKPVKWRCPELECCAGESHANEWYAKPNDVVNRATGCKKCCRHLSERKAAKWLNSLGATYKWNFLPEWCVFPQTGRRGQFDFKVQRLTVLGAYPSLAVWELDGIQHFSASRIKYGGAGGNTRSWEEERKRDLFKMACAIGHDYRIVRTLSRTVMKEKESEWMPRVKAAITNALTDPTAGIWLAYGTEYDELASDLESNPDFNGVQVHRY